MYFTGCIRIWSIIGTESVRMIQGISSWNEVLAERAFSRLEPKPQLSVVIKPMDFQSIVVQSVRRFEKNCFLKG